MIILPEGNYGKKKSIPLSWPDTGYFLPHDILADIVKAYLIFYLISSPKIWSAIAWMISAF